MSWTLKILFFANFLFTNESPTDIYSHRYQICHYYWVEDFKFRLELKENKHFNFTRLVYNSKLNKTTIDFVTGSYNITGDTVVLKPSVTTNESIKESESISYLLEMNKLSLIDNLIVTILPGQFEKSKQNKMP